VADLLLGHPSLYLRIAVAGFSWLFLSPTSTACLPIYTASMRPTRDEALRLTHRYSKATRS